MLCMVQANRFSPLVHAAAVKEGAGTAEMMATEYSGPVPSISMEDHSSRASVALPWHQAHG